MFGELATDIAAIQRIESVPTILEAVAAQTGLRFVCIARVTGDSWTACAVLDNAGFGLKVGGELDVTTTLCEEVRDTGQAVIIDSVKDDEKYRDHHTPRIYGFQSYISIPIFSRNGEYFGTLCGLDAAPAKLSDAATVKSMTLFAHLISLQLQDEDELKIAQSELERERESSELREQFIAVLGHDLRNPLGSIQMGIEVLKLHNPNPQSLKVIERIGRSASRIAGLVDDVVDFTRGRMGGGISLSLRYTAELSSVLQQVVDELRGVYPDREIEARIAPELQLICDSGRLGQLLSNLLKNALVHGSRDTPIFVSAARENGILRVAVTNRGATIPPDVQALLFKPFWRGAPQSGSDGLGLGLYIVSEIARSHGGVMSVASADNITTFTFSVKGDGFVERRVKTRDGAL